MARVQRACDEQAERLRQQEAHISQLESSVEDANAQAQAHAATIEQLQEEQMVRAAALPCQADR